MKLRMVGNVSFFRALDAFELQQASNVGLENSLRMHTPGMW